jgi:hypothetical protein
MTKVPDGTHRYAGHQRRTRTIDGIRIEEQEYPDGSVSVFVDWVFYHGTFDEACEKIAQESSTPPAASQNPPMAVTLAEVSRTYRSVRDAFFGTRK